MTSAQTSRLHRQHAEAWLQPATTLVPLVQPGDVVVHYDSRQEAIVGVSVAASAAEPAPIYWVARGSYARRAGEQARWLPGLGSRWTSTGSSSRR